MEKYWKNKQPSAPPTVSSTDTGLTSGNAGSASLLSDYDRYRRTILSTMQREGWESELRRYEKDMPADVSPETDIIQWWQVCSYIYPT
jgi:hypothetical protein